MKTYIIEIPVTQTNEDADSANAANYIEGRLFNSIETLKKELLTLDINNVFEFTIPEFTSFVNNGNDSFSNSYLAYINIGAEKIEPYKYD